MNEAQIRQWLVKRFAAELEVAPEQIDVDAHVSRLALDSAALLSITGELEDELGTVLPTDAMWACPSLGGIARVAAEAVAERAT